MNRTVLLTGIFVLIFVLVVSFSVSAKNNLSDSLLRLHIIADSDNDYDQQIKLKVRDYVISEIKWAQSIESKSEIIMLLEENIENLNDKINQFLIKNGVTYKAECYIGKAEFPTKQYGNVILPKGTYDSLIVKLGEGVGRNWWCVLYPSLCFVDDKSAYFSNESSYYLDKTLDDNVKNAVLDNNSNIVIKFKLLELIKNRG